MTAMVKVRYRNRFQLVHKANQLTLLSLTVAMLLFWGQRSATAADPATNQETSQETPSQIEAPTLSPTEGSSNLPPIDKPSPTSVIIDTRLVIRINERRVYVYRGDMMEISYPIAVGKEGWETPTGTYKVMQMIKNPSWEHPWTGEVIEPGPDNPLGTRWIGFWTDGTNVIGFHGTPNIESVGTAASHGCIRMYDQDVQALFEKVKVGTPVMVEP